MKPVILEPTNSLEMALTKAQDGQMPMAAFLELLAAGELFIASVVEVRPPAQGVHPLLFDRDGVPMAAVYTDSSRTALAAGQIKSVVRMRGRDIFRSIPPGYGVVLNPGFDKGLELLPEGVRNIVENFCG